MHGAAFLTERTAHVETPRWGKPGPAEDLRVAGVVGAVREWGELSRRWTGAQEGLRAEGYDPSSGVRGSPCCWGGRPWEGQEEAGKPVGRLLQGSRPETGAQSRGSRRQKWTCRCWVWGVTEGGKRRRHPLHISGLGLEEAVG